MDYFVTSETTHDVTHSELLVFLDFENALNHAATDISIKGVEHVGLVAVIMNPAVCKPFPTGVIFRRSRQMLDIKPAIEFAQWKAADRLGRIELLIDAVRAVFKRRPVRAVVPQSISDLDHALRRGLQAMAS